MSVNGPRVQLRERMSTPQPRLACRRLPLSSSIGPSAPGTSWPCSSCCRTVVDFCVSTSCRRGSDPGASPACANLPTGIHDAASRPARSWGGSPSSCRHAVEAPMCRCSATGCTLRVIRYGLAGHSISPTGDSICTRSATQPISVTAPSRCQSIAPVHQLRRQRPGTRTATRCRTAADCSRRWTCGLAARAALMAGNANAARMPDDRNYRQHLDQRETAGVGCAIARRTARSALLAVFGTFCGSPRGTRFSLTAQDSRPGSALYATGDIVAVGVSASTVQCAMRKLQASR